MGTARSSSAVSRRHQLITTIACVTRRSGTSIDVITNGYGVMYSYASRVEPADRWAIAAYIRALQLSHNARPEDVPPNEQSQLQAQQ